MAAVASMMVIHETAQHLDTIEVIRVQTAWIVSFGIGLLFGSLITGLVFWILIPSMVEGAFKKLNK